MDNANVSLPGSAATLRGNMEAIFETNPVFLSSLLGDLKTGKIQLPDFQRGWVWEDERIRSVLASVS